MYYELLQRTYGNAGMQKQAAGMLPKALGAAGALLGVGGAGYLGYKLGQPDPYSRESFDPFKALTLNSYYNDIDAAANALKKFGNPAIKPKELGFWGKLWASDKEERAREAAITKWESLTPRERSILFNRNKGYDNWLEADHQIQDTGADHLHYSALNKF